ncbi:O-linked N-acetylglucosamine transferase family protein, partial [Trichothermofontia sp.]
MSQPDSPVLPAIATAVPLSQQRQQLVERWLAVPEAQLRVAYETEFRQALLSLRSTNLRYLPLSEAEQGYVQQLEQRLQETRSLQILLALTPYGFAYQSSINFLKGFPIPGWLLPDLVDYLLEPIAFFREVGDADRYANFLLSLGRNLAAQVRQNPDAPVWQDVAQRFATANFLPCYTSTLNLKELYQLRSQLLEVTLKTEADTLDYPLPPRSQRQWLKLGVLVSTFLPNPETLINLPIFDFLNHKQFHITLYSFSPGDSSALQYCRTRCDRWALLPENISEAVDCIRQDDLDILWVGTDVTSTTTLATRLCHYRLARLQVTSGTSPVSSGVRHIDYYLLGSYDATAASPAHYSETLAVIPGTGTSCWGMHLLKTNLTTVYPNRHDWQADDNTVILISGASLNKLIPEVLHTWAALLAQVPNAMLILYIHPTADLALTYPTAEFVQLVREILAKHQVEAHRFVFLEQMATRENVKAYLRLADLYLDTFPATSPEAVIDALEVSLPIVTLAGETLRQTYTASLLRDLQLDDWVTHSLPEYFDRARLLASDPARRRQQHQQLREKMADWPNFLNTVQFGQKVGQTLQTLFSQWLARQETLPAAPPAMPTSGFGSGTPVSSSPKTGDKKSGRKSKRAATKLNWAVLETDAQLKQLLKPITGWLAEGEYGRMAVHCETAIVEHPQYVVLQGYLAIAQVLQGQVEKAKATLETALSQAADASDRAQRTDALVNLLIQEAEAQKKQEQWLAAVRLRQQAYQLVPDDCANRLWILDYAVRGKMFSSQTLYELKIIEDLTPEVLQRYGTDNLPELLKAVIEYDPHSEALLALTTACLRCVAQPQAYGLFMNSMVSQLANVKGRPDMAVALAERYLDIVPEQTDVLRSLASVYVQFMTQQNQRGLALAKRYDELAPTLLNKLFANHLCMKALQGMGRWTEVSARWQRHKALCEQFAQLDPALLSSADAAFGALATSVFLAPYFEDAPRENSRVRHQVIQSFQQVIARENQHLLATYTPP